jgi:ABC-2 type transport system ATP-binding protein
MSVTLPADPVTTKPVVDNRRAVIRTVDLTKIYTETVKAVDSLNLTVYQGEIFGLLGPNGAGKTTSASMLTTRTIPTHGQAFVGDVDVVVHPAIAKQLIGVVPQTNTLDRALAHPALLQPFRRWAGLTGTNW